MSQHLLSIITISLNAEKHIARALESVARQENDALAHVEHLLVDGLSNDKTLEIARTFPHVKIHSQKDFGISDAFNRGISVSTGKWILFLNSDDALADARVLGEVLPVLTKALENGIDSVYGRLEISDSESFAPIKVVGRDTAWQNLSQRMTIPHPSTFVSRKYFEEFGAFDTHFKIAMDYEILLRGYRKIKFLFIDRVITRFSTGGISVTKAGWPQANECLRAKVKNHVSSWPSRITWWGYQGLRWSVERKMKNIPWVGPCLRRVSQIVDRGF